MSHDLRDPNESLNRWLEQVNNAAPADVAQLLDTAPECVQELRGAFEDPSQPPLIRAASAGAFLEGFYAAT